MGALRILTSQMLTRVSPAGELGSREEEEEEAVGTLAEAEDLTLITLPPSEKL